MFKIKTFNAISLTGLKQFPQEKYIISTTVTDPDAILLRSHLLDVHEIPPSVKVIGRAGAGVNNIPVAALTRRGIPVFNTPGANANAVRELVIAGMFLASRHICQAWHYVTQLTSRGDVLEEEIEKGKKQFVGTELFGKTLGIVGLGSIGVKVANAAIHLGMRVIGYDPTISVSRAWELSAEVEQAHRIDQLLVESDFVTFHVPLIEETRHMINAARLKLMKSTVVILNFARDGILDNQALHNALMAKKIAYYVSDFPCELLKNHPRVISMPHLGASTAEAEENCAMMIVKQVQDFLEYGAITHAVNFPTVEVPTYYLGTRLAIVNINIPNMVAQISAQLANAGLNITSLRNQSRDEIAYTLIDVDGEVGDSLLQAISVIPGVIQWRKLPSRAMLARARSEACYSTEAIASAVSN